ncbi:MAG: MBL fold metallo-hydrolase [Parcubacteria group bacterium]|nr:MBL fold metallo-hydrolase [Parcubacteria group bacterium]
MKKNYKVFIISGLAILNLFLLFFIENDKLNGLKVYFFDVGQGDSVFIETGDGKQVLIDGGPDNKVIQRLSEVMPFWDRTIDIIILTHPDQDHIAGLPEVLKRYKVRGIVETGIECQKPECLIWKKLKEKEGAAKISARLGDKLVLDENTRLLFFNPFDDLSGEKVSKANNTSVVVKLIFGGYSFLLTGDIEKQIEEKLVLAGIDVDSDYLKIAHHGSKTSSAESFLDGVSPLLAFISSGNRYGHPHQEVTERLESKVIKYYRTDESGTILLICKLNSPCQVKTEN